MSAVLDIKRIDELNLEDPNDAQELGKMIDDVCSASQPYLQSLACEWERNILFFIGDQWLYFNDSRRRYEVVPTTKYNKFIPRPVTNLILPIVQTMTSIWTRQQPNASVARNSTDPSDENAAKLAERIQDAKWEMDQESMKHIKAALILCLCGTVARKDYWDSCLGPDVDIPGQGMEQDELPQLPGLPQMPPQAEGQGLEAPQMPQQPMAQSMPHPGAGEGLFDNLMGGYKGKAGDNAVEIIDPFRFIKDLQTESWIVEMNAKPISWIKQQYGKTGPGYFPEAAAGVKEDEGMSAVMELFQRLKTSLSSGGKDGKPGDLKGCAVVKEAYIKPTQNHPNGIMVVRAGGQTLFVGDSPYYYPKDPESWHPYSFAKYQELFFRWHGLPLVTNLIKLQERLNSIDALIALARKTTAIPQKLKPVGCGIPEGYWTGQPGLEIPYNPVGSNGAKPEPIPAMSLSLDVWKEREQVIASMHQVAGDNEVISGQKPEGVDTVGQMQMMLEQSYSKFNPFLMGWEKFIESGQTKKLRLIQTKYKEPRNDFINRLKELNKDNLDVEISSFMGADLQDNVSVRIEAGSSFPRSPIVQQNLYQQMASGGMFGPLDPISNPIGNKEFLDKFGLEPIETDLNADVKRARWVVGVLTSINRGELGPESNPPILPFDNLQIHLKILTDRMKHPEFKDSQKVFQDRFMQLQQALAAQQAQQQQAQMEQQAQQQAFMASQQPQGGRFPLPQQMGTERPPISGPPQGAPIQ